MNKDIYLCAIGNLSSGNCSEDCKFCTQSSYNQVDIEKFRYKEIDKVVKEAQKAKKFHAVGFCLVTSGKSLDDKKCDYICKCAYEIKSRIDIKLIACNGTASLEQLKELKKSGIDSYNHNLESSKDFYPNICSTHKWEDRYQTCINIKRSGLKLCSGGILGLGESEKDRIDLIGSLKELDPSTTPINFFHPNNSLPLENRIIKKDEALFWIKKFKNDLPNTTIMIAGGRELVFGNELIEIFEAGASSIVIGDYLTTSGAKAKEDMENIKNIGYNIAKYCE